MTGWWWRQRQLYAQFFRKFWTATVLVCRDIFVCMQRHHTSLNLFRFISKTLFTAFNLCSPYAHVLRTWSCRFIALTSYWGELLNWFISEPVSIQVVSIHVLVICASIHKMDHDCVKRVVKNISTLLNEELEECNRSGKKWTKDWRKLSDCNRTLAVRGRIGLSNI
jgi:hypothetical protein